VESSTSPTTTLAPPASRGNARATLAASVSDALEAGPYPFIIGDVVKLLIAR
jgi:hypothetical protein